jgi:hypothetical protein
MQSVNCNGFLFVFVLNVSASKHALTVNLKRFMTDHLILDLKSFYSPT